MWCSLELDHQKIKLTMDKNRTTMANSLNQIPFPNSAIPAWLKKVNKGHLGSFGLGLLAYNTFYSVKNLYAVEDITTDTEHNETITEDVQTQIDERIQDSGKLSTSVNDQMSFGEAFQASRTELGPGNFFSWNGRWYNNYTKEEWENLDDQQKADFTQEAGLLKEEDFSPVAQQEKVNESDDMEEQDRETLEVNLEETDENIPLQQVEYFDRDKDGVDDGLLINNDNDINAEIMIDWSQGNTYALVDTGNTGMMDTVYLIDEEGNLHSPSPLADEIPAPKLTSEQLMDLVGNDGIIDSVAYDNAGDSRADEIHVDVNQDGVYDIAYLDTDGNGKLNIVCKIDEDGQLSNFTELSVPFESPMVKMITDMINGVDDDATSNLSNPTIQENDTQSTENITEIDDDIPGMDPDVDMSDYHG